MIWLEILRDTANILFIGFLTGIVLILAVYFFIIAAVMLDMLWSLTKKIFKRPIPKDPLEEEFEDFH